MRRVFPAFSLALLLVGEAWAQCPPSSITVNILEDGSPGCAALMADDAEPRINITNGCGDEDLFHMEAGVDCPNCGPPVTLRAGTFGPFIAETRGFAEFTPTSPPEEHVLSWTVGNDTGTVRIQVVPNIVDCPEPDMGNLVDAGPPVDDTPMDDGAEGGCSTTSRDASWLALLWVFAAVGLRRATRRASLSRRLRA